MATPEYAAATRLLQKWQREGDLVCEYVLSECTLEELQHLDNSNYRPNHSGDRSAPDALARHIHVGRESMGRGDSNILQPSKSCFQVKVHYNNTQR